MRLDVAVCVVVVCRYGRSELFKVEKGLLHYGWGRWKDILSHSTFKRPMEEKDVENVAKAIVSAARLLL